MRGEGRRHRLTGGLYRNPEKGLFLGVCAGIADYFDISLGVVRAVTVAGAVFFFPAVLIAYLVLGALLKRPPEVVFESPEEETFWRRMRTEPADAFSSLRHRYKALDQRLQALEAYVTSREFRIAREIDNLER